MSRLFVNNLPKYATEDRIRDFFSQKGEITDAKLMRTKDGKSRQFAFIGYKTQEEAEEAMKFFNNSYMDTSKLTCEVARRVGDPNIPRPWSRYSVKEDSSLTENKRKSSDIAKNNVTKRFKSNEQNNDPKLQEFLKVMQPRAKSKFWEDDTLSLAQVNQEDKKVSEEEAHVLNTKNKESIKQSKLVKKTDELARSDDISDMDYFKSRVKKDWSDSESDSDDDSRDDAEQNSKDNNDEMEESKDNIDEMEDVVEEKENNNSTVPSESNSEFGTSRLFIRNLPYATNEEELHQHFSQFGEVSEVHVVADKDTKRSKGIAYVLFKYSHCAIRALEELDNSHFQGRLLHVMPAQPPKAKMPESNVVEDFKNFKQKREERRKTSEASGDTRAWNSLFIRPDTVVENIARKHGISKSDLLDREADDLPVRIALGEAQVLSDTKKYLSSAGVNVAALEESASKRNEECKRSNHIILVKNLHYSSTEGELANMFKKYGSIERIILPSTKALALVVFLEAAEARAAFKRMAYKRYKDSPLYLEWPPADVLCSHQKLEKTESGNTVSEPDKRLLLENALGGTMEDEIDPDRVESRSLYVKNLNFQTTNETLQKHFSDLIKSGKIKSVKVQKHNKNGKMVSTGYGFIEFDSVETASNVCRELQGTILDGHALSLQICRIKKSEEVSKKKDKELSTTKLIIRNVAFEATVKDLRQLFSPFGQIKSLRLPIKQGGHRGFAFVEFVTKQEAENAIQGLKGTHFYGRNLTLERAKEGETLEELRLKTASKFVE